MQIQITNTQITILNTNTNKNDKSKSYKYSVFANISGNRLAPYRNNWRFRKNAVPRVRVYSLRENIFNNTVTPRGKKFF